MSGPKAARGQGQSRQQRQEGDPIPDSSFSREASQAAKLSLTTVADKADLLRCSARMGMVQGLKPCLCDFRSCCWWEPQRYSLPYQRLSTTRICLPPSQSCWLFSPTPGMCYGH